MRLPQDFFEEEEKPFQFPWGPVIMMVTIFIIATLMEYFNWYPGL